MPSVFQRAQPARQRRPDWEVRLYTWLQEARNMPLSWGRFDCAIGLAAGAVKAQTGEDLAAIHLGQYGDELEAHRYMRRMGWQTHEDLMDHHLRRADRGDRHRGNIVLLESDIGVGFGVRVGRTAAAFSTVGLWDFAIPPGTQEWTPL